MLGSQHRRLILNFPIFLSASQTGIIVFTIAENFEGKLGIMHDGLLFEDLEPHCNGITQLVHFQRCSHRLKVNKEVNFACHIDLSWHCHTGV